jgi:hypothetical protein
MKTIGAKMFTGIEASRLFARLYHELSKGKQERFGESVRALFDKKITDADETSFYLTERDVYELYNKIT